VYYQIIHERKVRQILTNYKLLTNEWDDQRATVFINPKSERSAFIFSIRESIRWDVERLGRISRKLDREGLSYTADDIVDRFIQFKSEYSLFNYMEGIILKLRRNGKIRTSETYKSALNSFKRFRDDEDILLDRISSEVMEAFEAWHQNKGNTLNTISFYLRILRAVYNRALEAKIIENNYPFRHVYTGVDKTVKRALPLNILKKIKNLDLSLQPKLDYARDMFLLSFMLRGMSFIDMSYLRKSDLAHGYITYRRRKTGQQLVIKWTEEMQEILNKYPCNTTIYLLPIIRISAENERRAYRQAAHKININLKRVAAMVGIGIPLTLYVARHSWASVAKSKGIPVSVISEGMGHDSEATTQIYLASLDTTVVDRANAIVLKSLK
ncbi:MAG: site-specific integrase, partial [Muribaculaceae bacterium]|nr:site-specific integrase [Muribaculaceae bacterium]